MSNNMMVANREWANRPADQRFQTLDVLRDRVHQRRLSSKAYEIDVSRTLVRADGDELIIEAGNALVPTHWSFGQLCQRVGAPASYLRQLPSVLAKDNLNYGLEHLGEQDRGAKFLTYVESDDAEYGRLHAVTSPTYGRIWDADVADAVARMVERTGGKFYNRCRPLQ